MSRNEWNLLDCIELGETQTVELEKKISEDPNDSHSRALLVGYYLNEAFRASQASNPMPTPLSASILKSRTDHLIWLINNCPDHPGFLETLGLVDSENERELFQKASECWKFAASKNPQRVAVLVNCAFFFLAHGKFDEAVSFYRAAEKLPRL